jgi:hypothetical protein
MLRSLSALNRGRIETNAATRVRAITDAGAACRKSSAQDAATGLERWQSSFRCAATLLQASPRQTSTSTWTSPSHRQHTHRRGAPAGRQRLTASCDF